MFLAAHGISEKCPLSLKLISHIHTDNVYVLTLTSHYLTQWRNNSDNEGVVRKANEHYSINWPEVPPLKTKCATPPPLKKKKPKNKTNKKKHILKIY